MVKRCSYSKCKSDSRYKDSAHMEGVTFIPFPKPRTDLKRCKIWVDACGRQGFGVKSVKNWTYVCSKHFIGGVGPTEEHPHPIPALGSLQTQGQKLPRTSSGTRKKHLGFLKKTPIANAEAKGYVPPSHQTPAITVDDLHSLEVMTAHTQPTDPPDEQPASQPGCSGTRSSSSCIHKSPHSIKMKKKRSLKSITEQLKVVDKEFYQTVAMTEPLNDFKKKFYTGLPSPDVLTWLSNIICVCLDQYKEISQADQLFLTLMKLRLGLRTSDVAIRFGITKKLASCIVEKVTLSMASRLKFLIRWPVRGAGTEMRHSGTDEQGTTVLIDCLEFPIEEPLTESARTQTWSERMQCYTIKAFLAATHYGLIVFVSQCWGGSISNKELILRSGFLGKIKAGDSVIANRDFYIGSEVRMLGARNEICEVGAIATKRVDKTAMMYKAFSKLKDHKILSKTLPLSGLPYFDDVLVCCVALSNLQQ